MGLTFRSSIDGLDISANAENKVTAEVTFNNGLPTKSIDYIVTSGQSTGASYGSQPGSLDNILFGSDRSDKIVLGAADLGANGGAGNDRLVANRRDNILNGGIGNDTIIAHKGDDTIATGKGHDFVDGGDGIDTVVYENKSYQDSLIRKVGKIINVDGADTLTDIEFIQFSDIRISAATLEITPILKVQPETRVKEGDFKNTTVQLTFELSTPTSSAVQFSYNTVTFDAESSYEAVAGKEYVAKSGRVVIPRGKTKATLNLEVIGNTIDEEKDLRPFFVRLANISGATFEENQEESGVAIYIEDDDNALRINAGGATYTDSFGQQWLPSGGWIVFKDGQSNLSSNEITNTKDDILYQSEYAGEDFSFKFPVFVPNCSYEVTLEFAENSFQKPNQRIFDVLIKDRLVLDDFDVFTVSGGKDIPISRTFDVEVADNSLDINFIASIDNAKVSAIKIKPKSPKIKGCSWFLWYE